MTLPKALEALLAGLPTPLRERTRIVRNRESLGAGSAVIYWMRTALRVEENQALQVAIELANQLGVSVFVYHALSERYPYASDRHHTFILEAARELQVAFGKENVGYGFHLERPGHRGPHLRSLANRAPLVITEEMPVAPLRRWTAALAGRTRTPVLAVDTACVAPMQLIGQAYDRAFAFRNATKAIYEERLGRPPVRTRLNATSSSTIDLPFDPVDLQVADIAELVGQCEIDHAIGPVADTTGGTAAGYVRWNAFKQHGLRNYARRRNDALINGTSRMSAYLHYGMVSPMRIAREAAELDHDGARKYLDELLIWRELAYAFCYHRTDHARLSALPEWAISTLADHEADQRPALYSWETLARGQTGDALWDAAQRSLLVHGELHNNVRMTWGKAILNWTPNAKTALAMMLDLNHRYALDGRDPASYGGILWCLGQFDRPFPPARPIFGTVRDRSTSQHAKRLDPASLLQKATRPLNDPMPRVAIVGAGISGLSCARTLADHGFPVTVFEKSRGVGGRMSTRRGTGEINFDHGAQYFTVRDRRFRRYVDSWIHDGLVHQWNADLAVLEGGVLTERKGGNDRFVATPGMNAICKHLASNLEVRLRTEISSLERGAEQWQVRCTDGVDQGTFDIVVVSAPAPQAALLLRHAPGLSQRARDAEMSGCWALLLAFEESLGLNFDGAFVHASPISWVANNRSKPGRGEGPETWVVHASPDWSESHLEADDSTVERLLLDEFWKATGTPPQRPAHAAAHRWRFALPSNPLTDRCLFDRTLKIAACGDWCDGPRVEGAFLSGMSAAGHVMSLLQKLPTDPGVPRRGQLELF